MPPRLKVLLHIIGASLAALGAFIVVQKILTYLSDVNLKEIDGSLWLLLGTLTTLHSASNLLLAFGWGKVLRHHNLKVNSGWLISTFFISQIGKYIPGNIFHLAGRQLMGAAAGHSKSVIAKSLIWELALLSIVGAIISSIALPYIAGLKLTYISSIFGFTVLFVFITFVTQRYLSKDILFAALLYGAFLLVSGIFFSIIYQSLNNESLPLNIKIVVIASFTLSWLGGFLTPGSPAGLGVRELILISLLGPWMNEAQLIFSVVISRIIGAGGDLISLFVGFGLSLLVKKNQLNKS